MHIVFLDNFRGFQNEFTFLTPVSFLVGENSSGKTSFLAAVELLSSVEFWVDPSFNKAKLSLGSFQDIVSLNSKRRDYFTLGWFQSVDGQENKSSVFALLTFRQEGNRPKIFRFSFLYHDSVVKIQYSSKKIAYKIEKLRRKKRTFDNLFEVFSKVARSHKSRLRGFHSIDSDSLGFPHMSPLLGPGSFIKGFSAKKKQTSYLPPVLFASHKVTSIAPIRTKPQTIYDALEADVDSLGSHTPYILRRELRKKGKRNKLRDALQKFGRESGLFEDVQVHSFGGRGGAPSSSGMPFEVGIVLDKRPINMPFVGYGVSQVLPIAVDIFSGKEDQVYIIQQPEVHLHPRGQAAFGDLICASFLSKKRWFLIETHSDFLIDRFRLAMSRAKKRVEKPLSSVVFFERLEGFNSSQMILIDSRGKYPETQPMAFREFFVNENIDLLDI